jgi:hypothetical protein
VQIEYDVVHFRTSLVQLFALLQLNFEEVVQIIELRRFRAAPNCYPFAGAAPNGYPFAALWNIAACFCSKGCLGELQTAPDSKNGSTPFFFCQTP